MVFDITVIICTRNRAASLHETLSCLAAADRVGLEVEIIVVDNGGADSTRDVVQSFASQLTARWVFEPKDGVFGKSYALNRALAEGPRGQIIAILDDDMSPHPGWFQGVAALSRRWPDKDLFTGRSYVVWPFGAPEAITRNGTLRTWMYSVIDEGGEDRSLGDGRWFSGNHFWFRSRCLDAGVRFDDIWLTEPKFMLDLMELGYGGVSGPDAVVGHRVQQHLLDEIAIRERAMKVGRSNAEIRLCPYRRTVKHARFLNQHPLLGRGYCCAKLAQSGLSWLRAKLNPSSDQRFVSTVIAIEMLTYHLEMLRIATRMRQYHILQTSTRKSVDKHSSGV